MFFDLKIIVIAVIATIALSTGAYWYGRWDGSAACDARHASETLKVVEKVRKTDAKIKRESPGDIDKRAAIEWLQQYVRQ